MRRIISLLLTIVLICTMVAFTCVTAYAANYTTVYGSYPAPDASDSAHNGGRNSCTTVSEIKWMQAALNYCIKYKGVSASLLDVDGAFGPASATATKAFQRKYGLSADGWFGANTIAKMKSVLGGATAAPAVSTVSTTKITLNNQSATTAGSAAVTATYGKALPAIIVPKRTGYTFGGYYTLTGGIGTQYYTATGYSARAWDKTNATCTLYAKWTANKVTTTVTLNNQSATTAGTTRVTATKDSAMPYITVPKRTGYTFGGYYTSTGGNGTQYYTASGYSARSWDKTNATCTLYAKWTANKVTTTVTLNNQSATTAGTTRVTATKGSAMPYITVPKRTGYTFGGYYTSTGGNGTQYYTASGYSARSWDKTNATYTLYAKWTANKVTTTVTLNNQSATTAGTTRVTATKGSGMPYIIVPKRTGYTFGGYYSGLNGNGIQYYTADGKSARKWDRTAATMTLFAKWEVSTIITFDFQGGGTALLEKKPLTSVTAIYGKAMPQINKKLPWITGYDFGGYYDRQKGEGTQYYDGTGAGVRTWNKTDITSTLYARWILRDAYRYLEWERILNENVNAKTEELRAAGGTIDETAMADIVYHEARKLQIEFGPQYPANPELLGPLYAIDDPQAPWYISAINASFAGFTTGFNYGLLYSAIDAGASGMGSGGENTRPISKNGIDHTLKEHMPSKYAQQLNYKPEAKVRQELENKSFFNPNWTEAQIESAVNKGYTEALSEGVTTGRYTTMYNGEEITIALRNGKYETGWGTHKYTYEWFTQMLGG